MYPVLIYQQMKQRIPCNICVVMESGSGEWQWRVAVESGNGEWQWTVVVKSSNGGWQTQFRRIFRTCC
jgi:hypothetical protein